jgi:hypothetical protein
MSVERRVEPTDDGLLIRERRRVQLADLFDADGRWVVHEADDSDDWEGYRRCEDEAGVYYLHHDDRREERSGYGTEIRVGERAVRLAAQTLIEDGRLDVSNLGGESA